MPLNLHFRVGRLTSALNAAVILAEGGRLAHEPLGAALAGPAKAFQQEMRAAGLMRSLNQPTARGTYRFIDDLLGLSATVSRPAELARTALIKAVGQDHPEKWEFAFAGAIRKIESAFNAVVTETDEQLALRGQPLQQIWQSRGPGLVRGILQRTDAEILIDDAHITLVYPASGGNGRTHPRYNSVTLEAMLADPHPELPEVLRMIWLASQLNFDLPRYQARLSARRAEQINGLAMLPVMLAAGQDVELARCDAASVRRAMSLWQCQPADQPDAADQLWSWWLTYRDARPAWEIAIAALDRLIGPLP